MSWAQKVEGQGRKQGHPLTAGETLGLKSEQVGPAWCLWNLTAGQGLAVWLQEQGSGGLEGSGLGLGIIEKES